MNKIENISLGTITSPKGFQAGAVFAAIKGVKSEKPDLAVLYSEVPAAVAGVFTRNRVKAAPVVLCQQRVKSGKASAIVVNSGCANACNGDDGMTDAVMMAELAAKKAGVPATEVLVASTGVIGKRLPMEKIRDGIGKISLARNKGHDFARAIMTTDTVHKEIAVKVGGYTIAGCAKGSGMIHPDMATLLGFITTDAAIDLKVLQKALHQAVDVSFNMISVDTDTSTNDTVLLLANGQAGNPRIKDCTPEAADFQEALDLVCVTLAKMIARDGEGATRLIEVNVTGANSVTDARTVARTIVSSPLVKSAVHGCDPNWGRVAAAAGRSGVAIEETKLAIAIGGIPLLKAGRPLPSDAKKVSEALGRNEVKIDVNLNLGIEVATAWGCDLSEEYVKINSEYMT
ncbi:MAG: bifunctional glutamate N-acetyltransferase/amino-acid acetyltransferase ArgJ [Dehalococcoidales bacterium]|nr:bifunctional glutamate N-acetyltransferase/amino-acid acetyltransferase ArgJ [Dehalococcoidales bacterium]